MRWHAELILEAVLAVWLCIRPDGRKWFESLICTNFAFEVVYLIADRTAQRINEAQLWWGLIVVEVPLYALASIEASDWRPATHRTILFWWIALTMGCAWLRFYPYTGMAVIAINQVAFICWMWEKGIRELR